MDSGFLSKYFDGVAIKRLSAVEADVLTSNQHEFNGVEGLRKILGDPVGRDKYDATFMYLTDSDYEPVLEEGFLTWYDARQKARLERGIMRQEFRLYFPSNTALQLANAGDILVIAKKQDRSLLAIVAEAETTIAQQIAWLFGFSNQIHPGFSVREELETEQDRIQFASRFILETIGVEVEVSENTYLDEMLKHFGERFPTTRVFSEYARGTLKEIELSGDPDSALMAFMEREEILFRTFEKHLIAERLARKFDGNVDEFLSFSLSVQNRRKSRAGLALENHLEYIFRDVKVMYSRAPVTENKTKPDFLFPGIAAYRNPKVDDSALTMLGVKSTCKDRWRQVLTEADRIKVKHLLTLEAAISENQTNEMRSKDLQLVVPAKLHSTFSQKQQTWLLPLSEFVAELLEKQRRFE